VVPFFIFIHFLICEEGEKKKKGEKRRRGRGKNEGTNGRKGKRLCGKRPAGDLSSGKKKKKKKRRKKKKKKKGKEKGTGDKADPECIVHTVPFGPRLFQKRKRRRRKKRWRGKEKRGRGENGGIHNLDPRSTANDPPKYSYEGKKTKVKKRKEKRGGEGKKWGRWKVNRKLPSPILHLINTKGKKTKGKRGKRGRGNRGKGRAMHLHHWHQRRPLLCLGEEKKKGKEKKK